LKRRLLRVLAVAVAAWEFAASAHGAEFFFRDGDAPVVFLGDSITEQGMYPALIEAFVRTRFPLWRVSFRNAAWSGDDCWLAARGGWECGFHRDVLSLNPKAVLINLGMNDARGEEGNIPFYVERQTALVRGLAEQGARVALLTPNPEERSEPGQPAGSSYNRMLRKFADALREVAARERVPFVDQLARFTVLIEQGRARGEDPVLVPDGIHPEWPGQLVTATLVLKSLGAPAVVSRATIDAAARRVMAVENCRVELQRASAGEALRFRREDGALPWPIPGACAPALRLPGFDPHGELSRYELKVTGLPARHYELQIDGEPVATFAAETLAAGVNLSAAGGPITAQAHAVLRAVREKDALFFHRWRHVALYGAPWWRPGDPVSEHTRGAELGRFADFIAAKEREIHRLSQPEPRVFALIAK
jgi:lysophospholipase L1-like esterase